MKVYCPCCRVEVLARFIDLETGWGRCVSCNEVFRLAEALPEYVPPGSISRAATERPPGARAIVARFPGELVVCLPPKGLLAEGCAAITFAAVWLGLIAFITTFVVIGFASCKTEDRYGLLFLLLFTTPFWLVGLGILAWIVWDSRGMQTLHCRGRELILTRRLLRIEWAWWAELDSMREARVYRSSFQTNGKPVLGAEVVHDRGSFVLPADTGAEVRWLVYELNHYLKAVREPAAEDESCQATRRCPNQVRWEEVSSPHRNSPTEESAVREAPLHAGRPATAGPH